MPCVITRNKLKLNSLNALLLLTLSFHSSANSAQSCNNKSGEDSINTKEIKVLMLGNSLMNGIQSRLTALLECAGYNASIVAYNSGGASLAQHNASSRTSALIAKRFDIVLLQEYSSGVFANQQPPYPVIAQLKEKIVAAGSTMALYQTWGYQPGSATEQIAGYDAIGKLFNAPVYAIGRAWEAFKANDTKETAINLFSDNHHASQYGQALTAYTLFAYLTQRTPVNSPVLGLTAKEALLLQKTAWITYQQYP